MVQSTFSPHVEKPFCETMDIDEAGELLNESVDMDQDYNPIVGELHKFVLTKDVVGLHKFLFNPNGEEVWDFPHFAELFDERDGLGRTPLQLALMKGFPSMVAALFEAASNVNLPEWRISITEKMCKKNFTNLNRDSTPIIVLALSAAAEKEEDSIDRALKCVKVIVEKARTIKSDEMLKDILKAKASFNRSVLHYAGQLGADKLIDYLIALHKEVMLFKSSIMEECSARKLPLHYAIDSNDKESIKRMFSETLGMKRKDLKEKLFIRIGRYCVRRSLFLFFHVCGGEKVYKKHQRGIVHKQAEVDFSKRILSPRRQSFSSEEYTSKVFNIDEFREEKSTAILMDKSCFGHLQMPNIDGEKQYTIIQTYQENPHRLEVVLCALTSLGDQVK